MKLTTREIIVLAIGFAVPFVLLVLAFWPGGTAMLGRWLLEDVGLVPALITAALALAGLLAWRVMGRRKKKR